MTYSDRVEARITVPSGGAAMSVSHGAYSAAQTVTLGAGSYYLTAAGGVSSLLTSIQTELNNNVQGYPTTAAAMQALIGGIWTAGAGWLCNESSGALVAAFGAPNLSASSSPTYGATGPRGGIDKAVGFDSASDAFSGGDVFDITGTDDVIIAWVAYIPSAPAGARGLISKYNGGTGWQVYIDATGQIRFQGVNGGTLFHTAGVSPPLGAWHVGIATIDRATGKARCGVRSLAGVSSVSAEATTAATTMANAINFQIGDLAGVGIAPTGCYVSAAYITVGGAVASGLSANLATALASMQAGIDSSFTVSMSADGRITISNSFWSCAVDFPSTQLRDVLGFEYDFNYPTTPAQLATALGRGDWTGASAYLCNESSGALVPVFGSTATTAASTPTYSNQGPRGGTDKAVGFDSAADAFNFSDNFDVAGNSDLLVLWVGKWDSAANRDLFSKNAAAGWAISAETTSIRFLVNDGIISALASLATTIPTNEWYIGIAALDRTAGTMRIGTHGLRSGTQSLGANTALGLLGNLSNAANLVLGGNAAVWNDGSGHQVAYLAIATNPLACATGLPANLSAALSNFATYMKSQTGTQQARGLFLPDAPLTLDGDPEQAPLVTDRRTTISPTKAMFALCGNSGYEHTGLVYSLVSRARVWDSAAPYENASWEEFARDCIFGLGHAWFTASSPLQFYWYDGASNTMKLLGQQANSGAGVAGWQVVDLSATNPKRSVADYTGLFDIAIGTVVSSG